MAAVGLSRKRNLPLRLCIGAHVAGKLVQLDVTGKLDVEGQGADSVGAGATGADSVGAGATGVDSVGAGATGADSVGAGATGADGTGARGLVAGVRGTIGFFIDLADVDAAGFSSTWGVTDCGGAPAGLSDEVVRTMQHWICVDPATAHAAAKVLPR
jgi:hypothetical protein